MSRNSYSRRYCSASSSTTLSRKEWQPAGTVPDTQSFGYDHLNRLTNASATGPAAYNHTYVYDKLGNIKNYAGTGYQYNDGAHKQAVTHLNGVQKFWYDANGNMTQRIEGGVTYN